MADLNTEAGVWDRAKPIFGKWARHINLTEEEAYLLLSCFEGVDKPDPRHVPLTAAIRLGRIAQTHPRSGDSLAILALALQRDFHVEKDLRTLRAWCQRGLIPRARKTKHGGHWRVKWTDWTHQERRALATRIGGHARMPKNLLRSRRWKNFEKKMRPIVAEYIPLLFQLDAEIRGAAPEEAQRKLPPAPTEYSLQQITALYQGLGRDAMRYLRFRLEARRLYLAAKKLTFEALAKRVGMSRRTMFRRYHQQAEDAMRGAATALTPEDRPEVLDDTLHDQVVSHFSEEAERRTSSHRPRIPREPGSQ